MRRTTYEKAKKIAAQVGSMRAAISVSFANQVVSSGTNFILGIYFVRSMDAVGFGTYGVGLAIVLLFSGVGNALILTQMVVHFPDKPPSERSAYLGRNFLMVLGLCGITLAASAVLNLTGHLLFSTGTGSYALSLSVTSAAIFYLVKDFFIRVAYSVKRESIALFINIFVSIATFSTLLIIWMSHGKLQGFTAMWVYGAGQLAGVLAGLVQCRSMLRIDEMHKLKCDMSQSLSGGRWALGGVAVTWLQTQAYVYMTAIFVGPTGVAYANAARIFVSPFLLVMPALNQITMPRLATIRSKDKGRVARIGGFITLATVVFGLGYIFVLFAIFPFVSDVILKGKYSGVGALAAAWCAVLVFQLMRDGAATVMKTLLRFRRLTISSALVSAFSLPMIAALSRHFGAIGAIIATGLAECSLAIILWVWIKKNGSSH